jgi:uncharacterized protein YegL
MSKLIDISQSVLSQNYVCFDTKNLNIEQIPLEIQDAKFGILNFKAVTANEVNDELDFLFTIDCSGSMSDMCSDSRTKMQHIIHTLKNMIIFFHEHPNVKVNITVIAFDTIIYEIVERTKITSENINQILSEVEKIIPRGSTNIEFALKESSNKITELKNIYPNNIISHIFMTDGEATDGSRDINILKSIVDPQINNAFIGFGIEHDASLLNGISSIGKSGYYFIDKLENAGLVYGEILHGIVYRIVHDVEIVIENGFIYDFKNNQWFQNLKINDIVSEANKTFNIVSSNPDDCRVYIKGMINDMLFIFPSTKIEEDIDFSTHIYRQRTLQLLYEVNDFCNRKREIENNSNLNLFKIRIVRDEMNMQNNFAEEKKKIKSKLVNLIEEIKKYMSDNNLNEDKVLKNLCDDIYICYRTFGSKFGSMFCTARQTSQGTQRMYTASNTFEADDDFHFQNTNSRIHRQIGRLPSRFPALLRQTNNVDLDGDVLQHEVSDFADTPYLTPQATQVMREISKSIGDDDSNCKTQKIY